MEMMYNFVCISKSLSPRNELLGIVCVQEEIVAIVFVGLVLAIDLRIATVPKWKNNEHERTV